MAQTLYYATVYITIATFPEIAFLAVSVYILHDFDKTILKYFTGSMLVPS